MKTYELQPTSHKDLFRVVDRKGDWKYYFHAPTKRYLPAVNFRLDTGFTKGSRFAQYLLNSGREEAEKRLEAAGERGDRVHQFIKLILSGAQMDRHSKVLAEDNKTEVELSDDEWDCILSFQEFWNRHNAILVDYEFSVWNLKVGYAGTSDALIRLRKNCEVKTCKCDKFIGKLGLIDWKSSGSIYENYGPQVAAYAKCQVKSDYTAVIRLGTRHKTTGGYEFDPYDKKETAIHFKEFLAAVQISDAYEKPFDPDREIYEVPERLSIVVEREVKKVRKPRMLKEANKQK